MPTIFPQLVRLAHAGEVERLALHVRKYYCGESFATPRINMLELLNTMGFMTFPNDNEHAGQIIAKDKNGEFSVAIFFKAIQTKSFNDFILAHLLGHYFFEMQEQIASGDYVKGGIFDSVHPLQRFLKGEKGSLQEERADRFAAYLLVPRAMLLRAQEKLADLNKTAAFFNQSTEFIAACFELISETVTKPAPKNFSEAEKFYDESERKVREHPRPKTTASKISSSKVEPSKQTTIRPSSKTTVTGMERLREIATNLEKKPRM